LKGIDDEQREIAQLEQSLTTLPHDQSARKRKFEQAWYAVVYLIFWFVCLSVCLHVDFACTRAPVAGSFGFFVGRGRTLIDDCVC
jgi:hypothetical protein